MSGNAEIIPATPGASTARRVVAGHWVRAPNYPRQWAKRAAQESIRDAERRGMARLRKSIFRNLNHTLNAKH